MPKLPLEAYPEDVAAAFTEWERRHRENPEQFATDSERLAGNAADYGEQAAPYFLEILAEIQKS